MSYRADKVLNLTGSLPKKGSKEMKKLFRKLWKEGIHGLCFSPYGEGQQPGDRLSEDQIRRRMEAIAGYTSWIRSFSCTEGNERIPCIAKRSTV